MSIKVPGPLAHALWHRSNELRLCWDRLHPAQMHHFLQDEWVLIIDDRLEPNQRIIGCVPIDHLAKITWPMGKPAKKKKH